MIEMIGACVPKNIIKTMDVPHFKDDFKARFVQGAGIKERRVSRHTTEELMLGAIELLGEFECLSIVTVTQTPEYKMPGPGFLIAKKLGVEGGAIYDLNLACDGYVKGLAFASIIANASQGNVLLLVGDTLGSVMPEKDHTLGLLFGNAATATLVSPGSNTALITSSYPSGHEHLNMKHEAFMNGDAVTQFAVTKVPEFLRAEGLELMDKIYFHQANRMILASLERKLKLDHNKVPKCYENYGNTSSASIPLNICLHPPLKTDKNILLCGFGAGLSISAMQIERPQYTAIGEI